MSYIRSGSNPEKLYIVGTGKYIEIMEGCKDVWHIPYDVFEGLIKKYHRRYHDYPCEYKGAQVEEVWVDEDGNEGVSDGHLKRLECKVQLSYEDHSGVEMEYHQIIMYDVTWEYIVYSNIKRFPVKSKPISALPIDLQKAIHKEIKEELRYEAITILLLTTDDNREEFLKYYREDNGNLCCLVLDKAKGELVNKKILNQYKSDGFGIKK